MGVWVTSGLGPHTATPGCRKQIWESWGRSADTAQRATGEGGGHSEQEKEVDRVMGEGAGRVSTLLAMEVTPTSLLVKRECVD